MNVGKRHGILAMTLATATILGGCDNEAASLKAENIRLESENSRLSALLEEIKGRKTIDIRSGADNILFGLKEECKTYGCFAYIPNVDSLFSNITRFATVDSVVMDMTSETVGEILSIAVWLAPSGQPNQYSLGWLRPEASEAFPDYSKFIKFSDTFEIFQPAQHAREAVLNKIRSALANPQTLHKAYTIHKPALIAYGTGKMNKNDPDAFIKFAEHAPAIFAQMRDPAHRECVKNYVSVIEVAEDDVEKKYTNCISEHLEMENLYSFAYRRWTEGGDALLEEYEKISNDIVGELKTYAAKLPTSKKSKSPK